MKIIGQAPISLATPSAHSSSFSSPDNLGTYTLTSIRPSSCFNHDRSRAYTCAILPGKAFPPDLIDVLLPLADGNGRMLYWLSISPFVFSPLSASIATGKVSTSSKASSRSKVLCKTPRLIPNSADECVKHKSPDS